MARLFPDYSPDDDPHPTAAPPAPVPTAAPVVSANPAGGLGYEGTSLKLPAIICGARRGTAEGGLKDKDKIKLPVVPAVAAAPALEKVRPHNLPELIIRIFGHDVLLLPALSSCCAFDRLHGGLG